MSRCLLLAFVVGCAPTKDDSAAPGVPTDSAGSTTTDPERPVLTSVDAWCYFHETGEQFYNWDAAAEVVDPQGADTLTGGTLVVSDAGGEVVSHLLACDHDTSRCTTTFRADTDGVRCEEATSYHFRFTVTDEDGNTSEERETAGRAQ